MRLSPVGVNAPQFLLCSNNVWWKVTESSNEGNQPVRKTHATSGTSENKWGQMANSRVTWKLSSKQRKQKLHNSTSRLLDRYIVGNTLAGNSLNDKQALYIQNKLTPQQGQAILKFQRPCLQSIVRVHATQNYKQMCIYSTANKKKINKWQLNTTKSLVTINKEQRIQN